ncbi:MAG: hypothetical protein M1541_15650, partial [Acidobacteria bacterium]|nr:hypothetical protein [Acidobacteriota bacterium]
WGMMWVEFLVFVFMPMLALGVVSWYLASLRTEAVWARRKSAEAEQAARLRLQDSVAREREVASAEAARRQALDELLSSLHSEERAYLRQRQLGGSKQRSVVLQERLYIGTMPVSDWSEQELTFHTAIAGAGRH